MGLYNVGLAELPNRDQRDNMGINITLPKSQWDKVDALKNEVLPKIESTKQAVLVLAGSLIAGAVILRYKRGK